MPRKLNQDAKPSEKLLSLYTLLLIRENGFSLTELSRQLVCSKQSVMRLLDQLEASRYGKLRWEKRGRESVYRLDRPKKLPVLSLNAEGLYQLALCRDFMIHLLPDSIRKSVDATLRQASAYLPDDERDDFFTVEGQAYAKGRIDYTSFQKTLQTLNQAIKAHRACTVCYQASLKDEPKTFLYAPKRLLAYHETLRFSGWVITPDGKASHDRPTFLLLHRMKEVAPTRIDTAHLPDTEDQSISAFGLIAEEPFTVSVRFAPFSATYAAERTWSADQKIEHHDDGSITLTMTARSSAEVISWALGFGDTAEVLAPVCLRQEIAKKVRAMAESYSR